MSRALEGLPGVERVAFDSARDRFTVTCAATGLDEETLRQAALRAVVLRGVRSTLGRPRTRRLRSAPKEGG